MIAVWRLAVYAENLDRRRDGRFSAQIRPRQPAYELCGKISGLGGILLVFSNENELRMHAMLARHTDARWAMFVY